MLKQVLELLSLPLGAEGCVEHPATRRLLPLMLVPLRKVRISRSFLPKLTR